MTALTVLIMLGVLATIVVLVTGIGSMAEGSDYDDQSHRMMFARVALQAFTVALVIIALLT